MLAVVCKLIASYSMRQSLFMLVMHKKSNNNNNNND